MKRRGMDKIKNFAETHREELLSEHRCTVSKSPPPSFFAGLNEKVELARIRKALRDCEMNFFQVLDPMACVEKAISEYGNSLSVSCSFGSCSVAVLHMALQVKPDIRVVFNNTGVEYPDTLEYKKLLTEKWNLNLIETQPIKSFWECLKRYGWPLYRGKGNKFGNPGKPQCCKYLKELPFKEFAETYGIKATITGLRAGESRVRMFSFGQFGQNYSTKKFYNIMKFNPIAFWNRRQVFSYLEEHAIPVNPIYSRGADRCGCMPCTGFVNWEKQLSHTNPRMYREVQRRRGVTLISDFTKFEDSIADNCGTIFEEGI